MSEVAWKNLPYCHNRTLNISEMLLKTSAQGTSAFTSGSRIRVILRFQVHILVRLPEDEELKDEEDLLKGEICPRQERL